MTLRAAASNARTSAAPRRRAASRGARLLAMLGLILAPMGALAAADDDPESSAAEHVAPAPPANTVPEMPYAQMASMMDMDDTGRLGRILVDQWEWRDDADRRGSGVWDAEGWYGGDYNKLWVRTEGDWPSAAAAQGRAELLWDRIVTRWWSLQGGARYDFGGGAGKGWAALGVQGLAPYWINVEATVYAGDAGSLAARFKAETDLRFTQRLILQPELELNAYSRADRAREQGAGLSDVDAGLRLRYEIRRELAPYLGLAWLRRSGASAQLLRAAGALPDEFQWLIGVRFWY
jgi:copper resistance protein B